MSSGSQRGADVTLLDTDPVLSKSRVGNAAKSIGAMDLVQRPKRRLLAIRRALCIKDVSLTKRHHGQRSQIVTLASSSLAN
jgi:hypothetical protein